MSRRGGNSPVPLPQKYGPISPSAMPNRCSRHLWQNLGTVPESRAESGNPSSGPGHDPATEESCL